MDGGREGASELGRGREREGGQGRDGEGEREREREGAAPAQDEGPASPGPRRKYRLHPRPHPHPLHPHLGPPRVSAAGTGGGSETRICAESKAETRVGYGSGVPWVPGGLGVGRAGAWNGWSCNGRWATFPGWAARGAPGLCPTAVAGPVSRGRGRAGPVSAPAWGVRDRCGDSTPSSRRTPPPRYAGVSSAVLWRSLRGVGLSPAVYSILSAAAAAARGGGARSGVGLSPAAAETR